jgi:hypothetical protein
VLLLLFAVTSVLLSIPAVQTKLGKMATNFLRNDFDVDITIKKVDLAFIGDVQLKEVLIKNHHADTLIFIDELTTSIFSYRNILNNKMEFGQIYLNNFILNLKTYKGEVDDALTVFVDKFDDGTVSDQPSGFLLTSTNLKLKNGYVELLDENIENQTPLFFKNIKGSAKNFKLEGPNVYATIRKLGFIENHNVEVKSLSSKFSYSKEQMNFLETELQTEKSLIVADIVFNYNREDFSDFNNKVAIEAHIKNADVAMLDLTKFYKELGTNDVLHFSTNITGTLNNFTATNLQLVTNQNAIINGDLNFKNIFNQENGFSLDAYLTNLTSDYFHLKELLPNVLGKKLPSTFQKFGKFTLQGNAFVTDNLINTKLQLSTAIGKAITDLELTNISDIDNSSYIGHINIVDFKLGEIVGDSLIGEISLEADIDGEGFTLETINTSVNGHVSKHQYKSYTYKDITINGVVKNKHFDGNMEVNDDNIKLNFNGLADFSTDIYTFDFKAVVDYCDLNKINLFKRDSISNIKGEIEIKVKGNTVDDLVGTIDFKNSSYTNQKNNYFFKDFNITSVFEENERTITINSSEIIDGRIKGNFKFNELGKLTKNSIGSLFTNYQPYEVASDQNLDFRFKIYNKIVEVFYPEVTLSANTIIRGNISSNNNLFRLNVKSPKIEAFTNIIDELNLQIDNKNPIFNTQLTVDKVNTSYYNISKLHLVNVTLNDTLFFRTEFLGGENNTENFNLSFYQTFNEDKKSVFGIKKSNFTFKENTWEINPESNKNNKVVFDNKTKILDFKPFLIASKNQKIEFFGKINDSISKDLKFKFNNVKLASITPNIDSLKLQGTLNGNLNYRQLDKKVEPTANLTVSNFNINNSYQGNLKVLVEGKNSLRQYAVDVALERDNSKSLSIQGEIDFTESKPTLDIQVDFEEFKLDAFSPLGEDVFTNIRGFAYGGVHVFGQLANPTMDGDLFLDQAGMYFPYLNVDYNFDGTSIINLKDQTFVFEDVTLKDTYKNSKGTLTGTLSHKYFDNWLLNLNISTKNLLVLNTVEEENSLYYGTGMLEGNATIKGPTDKLVIDVVGKTKKGTYFVIPISDVKTVESSQLVRFINKGEFGEDENIRKAFISEKLKGLSLNFNLEVTKDAVVEMVLDKATGSFLRGSGVGNLQIELDTKDKFDMYGDFIVDNGIYNFKYGGFINKPFTVKKGGSISWSGDPLTAILNIEAVYRVSANPRSLLENISSNRKIPIDLVTRFSGELFNSEREFDIEIPNSSSTVASELAFKLDDNDGNTKTTHFVSLLASGAFYNESDLSINTSGLVYGTASDMLSNALDNIFNQGNNKFRLKPVYTVGEKNKVDNLNINDQLAIALDYQLNDRILINGKLGVPIGSKEQSSVIGEVNVEFLLNEEGTFRSSVFNRQNEIQYTEEEEGYTQGIGLNYQIDFNNGKELLEKLGLKKKKEQDSINGLKAVDSITIKKKLINFKNKTIKND